MKLIKLGLLIFVGIFLNGVLDSAHYQLYNVKFEQCKHVLIQQNNYKSLDQAFNCVEKDLIIEILGTILSKEGSLFNKNK